MRGEAIDGAPMQPAQLRTGDKAHSLRARCSPPTGVGALPDAMMERVGIVLIDSARVAVGHGGYNNPLRHLQRRPRLKTG